MNEIDFPFFHYMGDDDFRFMTMFHKVMRGQRLHFGQWCKFRTQKGVVNLYCAFKPQTELTKDEKNQLAFIEHRSDNRYGLGLKISEKLKKSFLLKQTKYLEILKNKGFVKVYTETQYFFYLTIPYHFETLLACVWAIIVFMIGIMFWDFVIDILGVKNFLLAVLYVAAALFYSKILNNSSWRRTRLGPRDEHGGELVFVALLASLLLYSFSKKFEIIVFK